MAIDIGSLVLDEDGTTLDKMGFINTENENFCQFIAETGVANRSYYYSRYPDGDWDTQTKTQREKWGKYAGKLLKDINIKNRIAEIKQRERAILTQDFEVNKEWIINRLKQVAETCMQPVPDSKGTEKIDASGANKALELLGKTIGLYIDKNESKTKHDIFEITIGNAKKEK